MDPSSSTSMAQPLAVGQSISSSTIANTSSEITNLATQSLFQPGQPQPQKKLTGRVIVLPTLFSENDFNAFFAVSALLAISVFVTVFFLVSQPASVGFFLGIPLLAILLFFATKYITSKLSEKNYFEERWKIWALLQDFKNPSKLEKLREEIEKTPIIIQQGGQQFSLLSYLIYLKQIGSSKTKDKKAQTEILNEKAIAETLIAAYGENLNQEGLISPIDALDLSACNLETLALLLDKNCTYSRDNLQEYFQQFKDGLSKATQEGLYTEESFNGKKANISSVIDCFLTHDKNITERQKAALENLKGELSQIPFDKTARLSRKVTELTNEVRRTKTELTIFEGITLLHLIGHNR